MKKIFLILTAFLFIVNANAQKIKVGSGDLISVDGVPSFYLVKKGVVLGYGNFVLLDLNKNEIAFCKPEQVLPRYINPYYNNNPATTNAVKYIFKVTFIESGNQAIIDNFTSMSYQKSLARELANASLFEDGKLSAKKERTFILSHNGIFNSAPIANTQTQTTTNGGQNYNNNNANNTQNGGQNYSNNNNNSTPNGGQNYNYNNGNNTQNGGQNYSNNNSNSTPNGGQNYNNGSNTNQNQQNGNATISYNDNNFVTENDNTETLIGEINQNQNANQAVQNLIDNFVPNENLILNGAQILFNKSEVGNFIVSNQNGNTTVKINSKNNSKLTATKNGNNWLIQGNNVRFNLPYNASYPLQALFSNLINKNILN
jgi:hypothetical protein